MLGVLFLAGIGVVAILHQRGKPVAYRPDERPEAITSELARNLPPEAPEPRLTDVTRAAGLADFRNFAGDRTSQLPEDMGPGVAWGDFDNDGDDDVFLVSVGGPLDRSPVDLLPCALFENLGDGAFHRVSGFPELRVRGNAAAWGDYDGDGFLDLVVTGHNALRLFHNEAGSGRFTPDPRLPDAGGFWTAAAWADFDHDRRLDLYVCNYVEYDGNTADRDRISDQIGTAVPFTLNPASYPGGRNALYRQDADGTFIDVAAELKVQNPEGRGLGALWHDWDDDGWLDLYVANDVSDNVYYRNVRGRFEDISHRAWVADYRSAMGLATGDFDRDGDDDLHVTHWVAQENALYENLWANLNAAKPAAASPGSQEVPPAPKPDGTNKVHPVRFVDIADQKGLGHVALRFVGWGTEFVDLDQDGWLDLLVVNGSTIEADGPSPKTLVPQEAFLFWNERGRHFHNLAPLHSGLSQPHVSRGLGCADYDGDGDVDLLVADLYEGVRLYRNDMGTGNWLKLRLRSKNAEGEANGFGDGSTVIAWVGDTPLRRSVTGVSYLSQHSRVLHWGLGTAARVDRLEVRWHAGQTNVIPGVEANAMYELAEGETEARQVPDRRPGAAAAFETRSSADQPGATVASSPRSGKNDNDRDRLLRFWRTQRAAMDAMKLEQDNAKAIGLFREAIVLNPRHEDSRYYLGLCLASQGDTLGALTALAELQQLNPQSHRAWQQWGVLRALAAENEDDLAAAEQALEQAHRLNPEETGSLLVLGEMALLRGDLNLAEERLAAATHTNPRAVGGFFLRGYLAWKHGDDPAARQFLEQARAALGPDWQPEGATREGDVKRKQHVEKTPLATFWEAWKGQAEPGTVFRALQARLASAPPPNAAEPRSNSGSPSGMPPSP